MAAARRLAVVVAVVAVALVRHQACSAEEVVAVGRAERTGEVVDRLEELEEDGVLSVQGRTPQQVLEGLLAAALAHNLTSPRAVGMMNRNIERGRASVEQYVEVWAKALSKALDRAQKRRKERRRERRAEKERAKEAKRAAKAVERQEELRQASINQPLSASGIKLPPDKPYVHDGAAVLAAVRAGDAKKLLLLCDGTAVASDASAAEKGARDSISRRQTNADVDFIPVGDDPDLHEGPAVHVATARGDSAMLSTLLSKSGCGADVDLFNPRTGYTPLHLAVAQDDPAMVRLLIENGANLDIRSREAGMTALHLAVTRAATLPVGNTLQQQGDEAGKVRSGGPEYANLSDSLRHGCMHLLLAAGASTELEDHRKLCEQTAPQSHRILTVPVDTALHMAAGYGSPEVTHLLLNFGASFNAEDESGQTPARLAGYRNQQYPRRPQVLELLQMQSNTETLTLTGPWLRIHGLSGLARQFDAAGLALLRDVLALSLTELGERVELRKKQRRKLEMLLTKRHAKSREATEL